MTTGWPDAERPGVPMNPERSGSHWARDANCETVTADWNADVQKWAPWPFCPPEAFADDNDYLGPCLTPAEVAALVEQARREEREACAEVADGYAKPNDINAWGTHEEILRAEGRENGAWEIANDIRARGAA